MIRLTISFKKTTRDMKIYATIKSMEEKSEFLKGLVEKYIKENVNK